jgi:hypothetical protein
MKLRWMAVLGMATLAVGCYSDVPLDLTPTIPVDATLVGDWTCSEGALLKQPSSSQSDAPQTARLRVKAMDKYRYALAWQDAGQKADKYVAYASSIGGRTLFNVALWPPQDSRWWDHRWLFVAVDHSSGTLQIQVVAEGTVSGTERSPEELRGSFLQAMARGDILDQDRTVCRKGK